MIPEIPLNAYLQHISPPLPSSLELKLSKIMEVLETNGTVARNRWAAFAVDPIKARKKEAVVYKGLATIFNAVVSAAQDADHTLEQTFGFVVDPHATVISDRGSCSRPDAFQMLYSKFREAVRSDEQSAAFELPLPEPKGPHPIYDFCNPHEFKLNPRDTDKDVSQVVYDMDQILAYDPSRRFTFGTTIENRTMRLWFMSRATLLKTESFDFIKDRQRLVRFFLSLAFSSPTEMGWDPTITFSHLENGRRQYQIIVDGETYTTVSILSDSAADSPLGRGTRVWKVVDKDGNTRVLKDVWLDFDRQDEQEIRNAILDDVHELDKKKGTQYAEELEKRMLTILSSWRVTVDDDCKVMDDTLAVMLRGYNPVNVEIPMVDLITPRKPADAGQQSVGPEDQDQSTTTSSRTSRKSSHQESTIGPRRTLIRNTRNEADQRALADRRRYHYRVVFKECPTPLYDERSLDSILTAVVEVVKALFVIHSAGWVHRDISGGNVYSYGNGGLLGDFEYARHRNDTRIHNVRTGTPFFMAAEALSHGYLFNSAKLQASNLQAHSPFDFDATIKTRSNIIHRLDSASKDAPTFAYNPLHDLESVWWLIVYVLFFNDDVNSPSSKPEDRQNNMSRLFHGRMNDIQRFSFLKTNNQLRAAKSYLSSTFGPALTILEDLSSILTTAYEASEQNYPEIDSKYFLIHTPYINSLLDQSSRDPLEMIALQHVKQRPQDTHKASVANGTSTTSLTRKRISDSDEESSIKRSRTSQFLPQASTSQSTRVTRSSSKKIL
ncbi:hypothetical protein BDP27DRAFT_726280 [Rhodocollybia butyracea]|uniref:Fungal-type protein kinase domain-containing protein n=1 Tax=Rhodocollybia butyracea TaxID=206335 RepID=A0A9P5PU84_9AGAR|nr:hypothetical protein BDP27DRAFT_726280 [Rhodocollybia butyracea]